MPINIRLHLCSLAVFLKNHLVQWNLFYTGIQDEQIVRNQRRSTRLYLALLTFSIVILTFYYTITHFPETFIIESPSFTKYSTLVNQSSLQCPCSKIAVTYEQFIQIEPVYHEHCQSDFISIEWINHLYSLYEQSWNNSISSDFRRIAVYQFQTLRSLCQLAKETNKNELQLFRRKEFIESQVMSIELFQIQIDSFVAEFINSTPTMFLRTLQFVQNTTAQSLLMTGASLTSVLPHLQTYYHLIGLRTPFIGMVYTFSNGSTCTCSSSTATTCMGSATFQNDTVHGFQTGCYMMNALFKSTLEILYNQSFLDKLTNSSKNFQKLNSSVSNRTIEMLLSQMFVDHWSNTTSYERYFNACAPDFCQYIVSQRYDFLHIVTLLVGLFGGLSSTLGIIAPFIIMTMWPIVYKFVSRRRTRVNQIIVVRNTTEPANGDRLETLFQLIKRKMIELNLFKSIPPSQDQNIIRQQRYSTRVYLILLFTGLSILTLFASLQMQTVSVTIKMPTLTQFIHLYDQYPLTLNCPCSQATMKYNEFILYIRPQYHPVCSSDFVSPNWINVKFVKSPSTIMFIHDIRSQLETHFQLLSTLCHVSNQIVEDYLEFFYQTKFISQQVLSSESFRIQTDLLVEQFKKTIPHSFQNTLELIKANLELNQFIVPINSHFYLAAFEIDILSFASLFFSDRPDCFQKQLTLSCRCDTVFTTECYMKTRIMDNDLEYIIPGMFFSWFPFQSLLMSTLECLYNQSCLFQIKALINASVSPTNFSTLKFSSEFDANNSYDQIEILANRLFIQSWNNETSFETYFNQCYPLRCQYTYQSRSSLIYMITTIIGLMGGLTVVSRLLVPLIVKLAPLLWSYAIHRRRDNVVLTVESSPIRSGFSGRVRSFTKTVSRTVIELNLSHLKSPTQDPKIIRRNRYTTRIYLISLSIALIIILIYTSLRRNTITFTVNSPTISKYIQLYMLYPMTLKCPCSRIAFKYNEFISQIEPQLHQICLSPFVSTKWIESLHRKENFGRDFVFGDDFRATARLQFSILSKFCDLSQNTVNLSLSLFYQADFVTARVISRTDFTVRIEALIEEFKRTTADQFMLILNLIQATNYGNQLATGFASNWRFISKYLSDSLDSTNDLTDLPALTHAKTYGTDNCSCAIQTNCSKLTNLPYRTSNQSLKQTLSGFRVGCLPLDALLQSSLSCLYNQTCLSLMRAAIYYSKPVSVDILTYSSFKEPNTTIETMLRQLFVLKWSHQFSFDQYFNACNPQTCQYSHSTKYNRVYILTILIALFGGLIEGLYFIISCMALVAFKLYDYIKKKNNVVAPCSEQSNTISMENENNASEIGLAPTIITAQPSVHPIDEHVEPRTTRRERLYLVCLSLMITVVIVTASVVWFIGGKNEANKIVLPSTPNIPVISYTTTESMTTLTRTCHMTLKYQDQIYLTGFDPKSLVFDDFNRDSILDLVVTNYGDDTFSILLGNRNGTFQTRLNFSTGNMTRPWGIATGDFNNDTLLDLAVSLSGTKELAIFYGVTTSVLFIRSPNTLTDDLALYDVLGPIEAADLNDDGLIDLAVCNQVIPYIDGDVPLLIFFNTGDDRQFQVNPVFQLPRDYILIVIDDFDNDGKKNDLSVCSANGMLSIFGPDDYLSGFALRNVGYQMYGKASSMTKGRFNNDELEDLALVFPEIDTLQIFLAYGDGSFIQQNYPTANYPTSVTRINFNNDEIDDLAVLSCNRTVTIFLGTSIGLSDRNYLLFEPDEQNSDQYAHSLKVADLNRDGKDDLVFLDTETQSIRVLLGTGCDE